MEVGQLFDGKYKILDIIGRGGMGTVYLGQNTKLGTLWAIKEIRKKDTSRIDAMVETNILKMLNHPALPRIFDVIEDRDYVYIIADYIEGVSLDKELKRVGKFSEETVVQWMRQICQVLIYLHSFKPNPIIYRDMKPSNIILAKDGSIKLIDFGIAREYKAGADSDTIYIGTRGYAAPEQYGAGQTNAATDIYSLGVTIFSLLTGKSPNEPPFEIKPLRYYDKNISRELERIITKCTRPDPSERYQSVDELLSDVDKLIFDSPDGAMEDDGAVESGNRERPNGIVSSFKRIVLAVWGNSEFACEMAYMAARMSNLTVLLVNHDYISSKPAIYLSLQDELEHAFRQTSGMFGLNALFQNMEKGKLNSNDFERACLKRKDLKNLYFLSGNFSPDDYEAWYRKDVSRLIEYAYGKYDVTVLILNKSVLEASTISGLKMADYVIIPIQASLDSIREWEAYFKLVQSRYNVLLDKMKLVAYEYKKGISLPESYLKEVFSKRSYIGRVSYCREREIYRNLESFFAKWLFRKAPEEYMDILSCFGILPKRALMDRIRCRIKNISRKVRKAAKRINGKTAGGIDKDKMGLAGGKNG